MLQDPSVAFLMAVAAVTFLSVVTLRRDALIMCALLWAAFFFQKAVAFHFGWLLAYRTYPATDLLGLAFVLMVWWAKPEAWKLGMGFAIFTKLIIHVGYWGFSTKTDASLYNYILSLNILFGIEILCVSIAGGQVIADHIGNWVSSRRRGDARAVSARGRSAARSDD